MSDKPRASDPHDGPDQGQPPDPSPGVPVPASTSSEQAEADPAPPWWVEGGGGQVSADPADRPVAAEPGVMDSREPPGPGTGPPLDPSVATGPPWPRLVASGDYSPPRLLRWPIVVGIVLFVGSTLLRVLALPGTSSTTASRSPYVLVASDARFRATFPAKPQRSQQSLGTAPNQATYIIYDAQLTDEEVGVTYVSLPESTPFDLDNAITGEATSMSGQVASRSRLTYQGQPAEDGVITTSAGVGRTRVVRFGTSIYVLIGVNGSIDTPGPGYEALLRTFSHS